MPKKTTLPAEEKGYTFFPDDGVSMTYEEALAAARGYTEEEGDHYIVVKVVVAVRPTSGVLVLAAEQREQELQEASSND